MIIDVIAGARPNFMKVAALFAVAGDFPSVSLRLIHTGQHYDAAMSDVFLKELELPTPHAHLGVGSGTQAEQVSAILTRYTAQVCTDRPDACVVVGDVNSTLACAIVAAKEGILLAHVEAGLRSFDRSMPEEINRMVTDRLSNVAFVSEPSGIANLAREGMPLDAIHFVGNTMIDTLLRMKRKAEGLRQHEELGLSPRAYALFTAHRPGNVDDPAMLDCICRQLEWLASQIPVVFPVHPRTRRQLESGGLWERLRGQPGLKLLEPLGYLESLALMMEAALVVTDSGGMQEETSSLGVPCLTLRANTERPITVESGTSTLIGNDWELFRRRVHTILTGPRDTQECNIPLWDGLAGRRIVQTLGRQPVLDR